MLGSYSRFLTKDSNWNCWSQALEQRVKSRHLLQLFFFLQYSICILPFQMLNLLDSSMSYFPIPPENQHFCFNSEPKAETVEMLVSGALSKCRLPSTSNNQSEMLSKSQSSESGQLGWCFIWEKGADGTLYNLGPRTALLFILGLKRIHWLKLTSAAYCSKMQTEIRLLCSLYLSNLTSRSRTKKSSPW